MRTYFLSIFFSLPASNQRPKHFGLLIAISPASVQPHEIKLVDQTLNACFTEHLPEKVVGDRAYDSDQLYHKLADERNVQLIAPHKNNRGKEQIQDSRILRRYKKR